MLRSDSAGRVCRVPIRRALLDRSAVIAVGIAGAIFAWAGRRWSWEGLGLGVLGWWLAATVATSLWLPGVSYAFLWPLLAILAGQAVAFLLPQGRYGRVLASWLGRDSSLADPPDDLARIIRLD